MESQGEIILYQPGKEVKLEVRLENETVWLSIDEMSQLFGRDISVIGKHIRNIFKEGNSSKIQFGQNLPTLHLMAKYIKLITTTWMLLYLWATV